tara:strand:- start:3181 stop:3609 length:429 start_codon:yes stop_codon:yes gene_type:complete
MNNLLIHALDYSAHGFAVFPLRPRTKIPLTPNGFKNATKNPEQIKSWWALFPDANIGIATGKVSGLWVLDVDGEYPDSLPILPSPTVKTAKGYHYYFICPTDEKIQSRSRIEGQAIDVRGDGGYVVAPPSIHPNGHQYVFIT